MSRIAATFDELRIRGRKGFIPFVSAGDPDQATSLKIVFRLVELGADLIELGVPFSDPMADGPTIQASSQRALASGMNLGRVLEMVRAIRSETDTPLVLFSYLNPLHRPGIERLADEAASAGVDGILVTDAIGSEALEISTILSSRGIDLISLVAPTTSEDRLRSIAENARGFIYAVSRAGVTGARETASDAAETLVPRTRKYTDLPVAVGFGISTPEQISDVWKYADAAVVGSAIVREIERSIENGDPVAAVAEFVKSLMPEQLESQTVDARPAASL